MKKTLSVLLALLLALSVTACSKNEASTGGNSITVTDMAGRAVTIDGPVEKVVVSEWSIAEAVFAVVGEQAVDMISAVGRTFTFDIYKQLYSAQYPQLGSMPEINAGRDFDPEAIIALEPDVLIVQAMDPASLTETVDTLEKAGIPTVMIMASDNPIEGAQTELMLIGQIFNAETKAQEIIGFISTQIDLINSKNLSNREDKPTVYIEKDRGTAEEYNVTFTTGQWATIIDLAGGENIAVGVVEGNTSIDPEYLLRTDPDYIIIPGPLGFGAAAGDMDAVINEYIKRTGWDSLTAVQNKNVYGFSHGQSRDPLSFYPTLCIAKILYPDEFADVDPDAILKEYMDKYMLLDYGQGLWRRQLGD